MGWFARCTRLAVLGALLALGLAFCAGPAGADKLSLKDQEALALKLFKQMGQTPRQELETFNRLYREVIAKCPDTGRAEISYWRLSNLLILGYEPPRRKEAIALLEEFLKRYPNSKGAPHVEKRLVSQYEQTKQPCKAAAIYAKIAPGLPDKPGSQGLAIWTLYGDALAKCGKPARACKWYRKVLAGAADKESLTARVAKDGVAKNCK